MLSKDIIISITISLCIITCVTLLQNFYQNKHIEEMNYIANERVSFISGYVVSSCTHLSEEECSDLISFGPKKCIF